MHVRMQERDGSFNVRAVLPQHTEEERESHTIHRDCSQSRLSSAFESASLRGALCLLPAGCVAQLPSCGTALQSSADDHSCPSRGITVNCALVPAMAVQ